MAYVDEYNPRPVLCKNESPDAIVEFKPLETKSLNFACQKEYRFFWYSVNGSLTGPDYVPIEIGSMHDIASYYILNATAGTLRRV